MAHRVLVTGDSGFTGSMFILSAIKKGFHCICLSDLRPGFKHVDLTDKDALREALEGNSFDYVVHLAAISFVKHGDLAEIYKVNVTGTLNLLDTIEEFNIPVKKILIASSANVYGTSENACFTERSKFNPQNDYAVSKVAMEYAIKFRRQSCKTIIVRPFNYTGVGQAEHFLIPKIVKSFIQKDSVLELGNLDVFRDFSDVRDVVSFYIGLLKSDVQSGIFNICSGEETSLKDVLSIMQQLSGFKPEIRVNPKFVRRNDVKRLKGDPTKIDRIVPGYKRFALTDTLNWMLKS